MAAVNSKEECGLARFHYKRENKYDKFNIFGDLRVGAVILHIRNETYYCIDMRDLQTQQTMHMEHDVFDKMMHRLVGLTLPNLTHRTEYLDDQLTVELRTHTNCFEIKYNNQIIALNLMAVDGLIEMWTHIKYQWYP